MGIPLSKGEGRVRVQHGGLKNLSRPICSINAGLEVRCKSYSRQTGSINTILELSLRGVPVVTKLTDCNDQCTPWGKCINFVLKLQTSKMFKNKWLKKGGCKNLSHLICSINTSMEGELKKW